MPFVWRWLLLIEALAFGNAALVHFGFLVSGYAHRKAGTAEAIIGVVLLVGWVVAMFQPAHSRAIAIAVQGFALLATIVGGYTMAVGVGPRTAPDVAFHAVILIVLIAGLWVLLRSG